MEQNLLGNGAKNKMLFYVATVVLTLFLMVSFVPNANAQADTTPPDDVENLQIEVFNGAVKLSWDVATDDMEVIGYKIYSGPEAVTPEEGEYSNDVIDAGDVIEYVVDGLTNGEEVFFAVTAYDAAGNESENYSDEVYGTPEELYGDAPESIHMAADELAPTVNDAQAVDKETVKVEFSEAIVLPALTPETAFNIIDNATSEVLNVLGVEMDPDDLLGLTVLLTTDPQEGGSEYILTAGIQIEDTAGNPIVSGTSDTAAFIGSTIEPGADLIGELPENDFDEPTVVSAESTGEDKLQVVFSEAVILDSDPISNFYVAAEDDATDQLDILSVTLDATKTVATLKTSAQSSIAYSVIVTGVLDEAGNEISGISNVASFGGNMNSSDSADLGEPVDAMLPDLPTNEPTIALTPENVKNLLAAIVNDIVVKLTWTKPDDASIIDQILYKSTDGGTNYDDGTSLGADREEVDVTGLTPGAEYYFKLTTKNADGVESDGMITHIRLPETGGGIGLLAGASLGLAALRRRKKSKK